MSSKLDDLTGQVFGYLTVKSFSGRKRKVSFWQCQCSCGNVCEVRSGNLKNGHTNSCGCFKSAINTTHGGSRLCEYRIWNLMRQRCSNKNLKTFKHYGGRGITVCERWRNSFDAFLDDMGRRPSEKHSIDRIDNNGNYEPGNCRWTTQRQQSRNKRTNRKILFNGLLLSVIEWCEITGVSKNCLLTRLNRGWSVEQALTKSVQARKR